jgi:4-diphosphocytidyl-2-C-methyl-D-erythritol kinase
MTRRYFAPAKVNLSLRVGPPQADGRHPLDSLVAFTRCVGDTIEVDDSDSFALVVMGPFGQDLSGETDNLVSRAATLLANHLGAKRGAHIVLTKNLPIASGIGGGSGDAAATLIGLNELWAGGLTRDQLAVLGAQLGADVPACILGQPLRMTGTGETTSPISSLPKMGIVLVNPLVACPTAPVYRHFDALGRWNAIDARPLPDVTTQAQLLSYLAASPNDLEPAARDLVPEIGDVLDAIGATAHVALARMSGSGATCFGLYETLEHAKVGAASIKNTLALSPVWVEADQLST